MKNIILLIVLSITLFSCVERQQYCGEVTKLYNTGTGYRAPEKKHIIFYCQSIKRYVDVVVTDNCYANTKKGQSVCFSLRLSQVN